MIYQRRNGVGAPYNAIIHARLSEHVMTLSVLLLFFAADDIIDAR